MTTLRGCVPNPYPPGHFKQSRFELLDRPISRIHRWVGHQQVSRYSGPPVDGWQGLYIFCSCGTRFEVVR